MLVDVRFSNSYLTALGRSLPTGIANDSAGRGHNRTYTFASGYRRADVRAVFMMTAGECRTGSTNAAGAGDGPDARSEEVSKLAYGVNASQKKEPYDAGVDEGALGLPGNADLPGRCNARRQKRARRCLPILLRG